MKDEQKPGSMAVGAYEPPKLIVIGPVTAFTFGSANHDQSDHSFGSDGGHKPD